MISNNNRIDEILNSLNEMQRATIPKQLGDRIMQQLNAARPGLVRIPRMMVWAIAAGMALLITLNISAIFSQKATENVVQMRQVNPLSDYFQSPPSI